MNYAATPNHCLGVIKYSWLLLKHSHRYNGAKNLFQQNLAGKGFYPKEKTMPTPAL